MNYIWSLLIGYTLGSISPAKLIATLKKTDLKKVGTKNLGATNVMLNFGKALGALCMAFDISKSFAAYKLSQLIFASNPYAGIVSGIGAILGHNYPFYLKLKGGKGFATFGGIILAYNWKLFLFLLAIAVSLMLIVNYTFIMPYSGSILFPVIVGITTKDIIFTALCLAAGIIIMIKHYENVKNAINGSDQKVRDVISDMFTKKKATENKHNTL